jgi:hypothetical protein
MFIANSHSAIPAPGIITTEFYTCLYASAFDGIFSETQPEFLEPRCNALGTFIGSATRNNFPVFTQPFYSLIDECFSEKPRNEFIARIEPELRISIIIRALSNSRKELMTPGIINNLKKNASKYSRLLVFFDGPAEPPKKKEDEKFDVEDLEFFIGLNPKNIETVIEKSINELTQLINKNPNHKYDLLKHFIRCLIMTIENETLSSIGLIIDNVKFIDGIESNDVSRCANDLKDEAVELSECIVCAQMTWRAIIDVA